MAERDLGEEAASAALLSLVTGLPQGQPADPRAQGRFVQSPGRMRGSQEMEETQFEAAAIHAVGPGQQSLRTLTTPEVVEPKHHERSEEGPGWGQSVELNAHDCQRKEVVRVILQHSEALLVDVDVLAGPTVMGTTLAGDSVPVHVWAQIAFGNGGTQAQRSFGVSYRFDTPLVVSYVDVQVYLAHADGTPIKPGELTNGARVTAQVSGFVSRGVRGLTHECTNWVSNIAAPAASGILITGAARLAGLRAHLTAAQTGPLWLQFFDQISGSLAANEVPVFEVALPSTPPLDVLVPFSNLRGFGAGVVYGVSSTAGKYTAVADNVVVEVEKLLL